MAVSNSGMTLYTDNNTQQSWTGTDDLDTEVFIEGSGSEAWLVGKNTTETGILTLSANMGAAKYFSFWMKSDLAAYYTSIKCELESSTNNYETFTCADSTNPDISGDFKPSMCQIGQGVATGTYAPASHTITRIIVDNSASGNIRAITNHWIDAMFYGTGRVISGSTTGNKLFKESDDLDKSSDTYDGCSEYYNGVVFFQTDVDVSTTTGNSYGETVVFRYARSTSNLYQLVISGTADLQNTSIIAPSGVTLTYSSGSATSMSMSGGSISGAGTTIFGSGQTVSGVVFKDRTSFTVPNTPIGCTFDTSGNISVSGGLTDCIITNSTAASSVTTQNLESIDGCDFTSDGSNHAVEITDIGDGTLIWKNTTTGYVAGDASGGSVTPVTPTSTGNETIYVNALSSTDLYISVQSGASIPSIRKGASYTGNVYVSANEVTFTLTVKNTSGTVIQGAMVYVWAGAGGSMTENDPIINKVLTDVNGQVSWTGSLSSNQPIVGRVRKASEAPYYKTSSVVGTISSASGLDLTIQMIGDG